MIYAEIVSKAVETVEIMVARGEVCWQRLLRPEAWACQHLENGKRGRVSKEDWAGQPVN